MVIRKKLKFLTAAALAFVLLAGSATVALSQQVVAYSTGEESTKASQTHMILIVRNSFTPDVIEIYQYDTVIWRNLNRPKRTFTLVSEDELWEDYTIPYGRSFGYAFNEPGIFDFEIEGEKEMVGTIVVRDIKELKEEIEEEEEEEEAPEGARQPQIREQAREQVAPTPTVREYGPMNPVLIVGGTFKPETLELEEGDTVTWRNLSRPKRSFVLVSEDGLFEAVTIPYGRGFAYTFEDSGTYTFSFADIPDTKFSVTVS